MEFSVSFTRTENYILMSIPPALTVRMIFLPFFNETGRRPFFDEMGRIFLQASLSGLRKSAAAPMNFVSLES